MDREKLERKYRPHLFTRCEICEADVRIAGHEHDAEKLAAYLRVTFPPILSVEERLQNVLTLRGYSDQNLLEALLEEVELIIRDSQAVG